jgi:hypothetical protein
MERSEVIRPNQPAGLRNARRIRNDQHGSFAADGLWCECGRFSCDAMVPAPALAYRRAGAFVVVPRHTDGDRPLVVDDRFVVVVAQKAPASGER